MPVAGGENSAESSKCVGGATVKCIFRDGSLSVGWSSARFVTWIVVCARGILVIQIGPKQENPDLGSDSHLLRGQVPVFPRKIM